MTVKGLPRVLFVCAEFYPIAKTGGLADACGGLVPALADEGVDARLLLPAYAVARAEIENASEVRRFADGGRLLRGRLPGTGLPIYLFDRPDLFARDGGLYQDADRCDWNDNHLRFAAFCRAATEVALDGDGAGWVPDLVHAHDWHTALVPALLALADQPHPPSVLTVHNLAYQGNFPLHFASEAGLPAALLSTDAGEFYGQISYLKTGIRYADRLTTVSPTYAREILTPEYGAGLDGILRTRARDLVGIMNGVDQDVWNPASDRYLSRHYTARDLSGKLACKVALQQELGLAPEPDMPLVCFVNRLTHQKMAEVVLSLLPALAARKIQFVLHGEGERDLEQAFAAAAHDYPRAAFRVGYREDRAHRVMAGSDISLIPSRFEPCGLTALYAMQYGTLPVSRSVGGLTDSVRDAGDGQDPCEDATGFSFSEANSESLLGCLDRACGRFQQKDSWRRVQSAAMTRDFSWATAARQYLKVYADLLPEIAWDGEADARRAA